MSSKAGNSVKVLPVSPRKDSEEEEDINIFSRRDGEKEQQRSNRLQSESNRVEEEESAGVVALLQDKFRKPKTYGSRMVGGRKPSNQDKYNRYEAVSYLVPDTAEVERGFLKTTPSQRSRMLVLLWIRFAVTGLVVSLVVSLALRICKLIEKTRVKYTTYALNDGNMVNGWLIWVGSSVGLNLLALTLVLLQPAAASSGIPGLIAYLNGVEPAGGKSPITGKQTSFVSLKTMGAKTLGMLCSIPSGLCIGPEGPIIHISALIGYWVTKLMHKVEEKCCGTKYDHETEDEKRDFLATGAACGITTAFRAPLAGTLFVVEEAGSFFSTRHLEFTFFSCLVSYWAQWVVGLIMDGDKGTGAKFQQTQGYFCDVDNPLNMIAYLLMAFIGGCLGAGFNQIVEKLNHIRAHHINPSKARRLLEVLFLTLLTGSVVVFLPSLAPCRPLTRDLMLRDSAGCLSPEDFAQVSYGEVSFGYLDITLNATKKKDSRRARRARRRVAGAATGAAAVDSGDDTIPSFYQHDFGTGSIPSQDLRKVLDNVRVVPEHRANVHDTVILDNAMDQGPFIHVHYEHTYNCKMNTFNDMAMLWLNGGVKGVKVLLQRGFPHLLSTTTLWSFLIVYFLLASITAGTHVPAGLVVPLLLIGGAFGRLFGLYWMSFKQSLCESYVPLESATMMMSSGTNADDWVG